MNMRDDAIDSGNNQATTGSSFLDMISILVEWRRFILFNFLVVTLIAVIISLILPKWYRATASILPPKEPDMFGSLGAASTVLKGLTAGRSLKGLGQSRAAYNYFAILKSRTAMEAVVHRFDLITVYDISDSSMEKAVKMVEDNVNFETQDDENLTIEVLDKDPRRAADMANYFVDLLNDISIRLGTQEARNNRVFIEERLRMTRDDLRKAEDSLRDYQERTGIIVAMDPEASGVSPVAELYGLKAKKEIELAILKRGVAADNPVLQQKEVELSELSLKLSTFPGVGIESLRLYRDLLIHQKIMEFLVPLHEQAKVDEQKDVPVLLVLDKAVPPEKKVKPQRVLIVFVASFLTLMASIVCVLFMSGILRHEDRRLPLAARLLKGTNKVVALYKVKQSI